MGIGTLCEGSKPVMREHQGKRVIIWWHSAKSVVMTHYWEPLVGNGELSEEGELSEFPEEVVE